MMTDKDYVCGDYGTVTEWTQIRVTVALADLETTTAVMSMINSQLQIEDYSDVETATCYGGLLDESILQADKTKAAVSVYIPADDNNREALLFIRQHLENAGIHAEIDVNGVSEKDWANEWKQYYKPVKPGKRIVIVPAWLQYEPQADEIIVRMDPGMAFGTGTHETTALLVRLLERYVTPGCRMLDVGTGSGILAICAKKLGAGACYAYDIDPISVEVAQENAKENGAPDIVCGQSDLLAAVETAGGPYDVICANIVADIIIRMAPDIGQFMHRKTALLLSGIIDTRADDVKAALAENGLSVIGEEHERDWCALIVAASEKE